LTPACRMPLLALWIIDAEHWDITIGHCRQLLWMLSLFRQPPLFISILIRHCRHADCRHFHAAIRHYWYCIFISLAPAIAIAYDTPAIDITLIAISRYYAITPFTPATYWYYFDAASWYYATLMLFSDDWLADYQMRLFSHCDYADYLALSCDCRHSHWLRHCALRHLFRRLFSGSPLLILRMLPY